MIRDVETFYAFSKDSWKILLLSIGIWSILLWCTKKWRNHRSRFSELAKCLPGPPTLPLVGNALTFANCPIEKLLERVVSVMAPYENVSPIRIWMGPALYVVVTDPRDIEVVLNSQQATNKGMAYKFLHPFIGDGLISGSGKCWKSHRKMVLRLMNQRILREYVKIFDNRSRKLVKKLMDFADGRIFDIHDLYEGCTIDIVAETVMGCDDINALENRDHEFTRSTAEMYEIVYTRMFRIWLYPDCIFRLTPIYERQCKATKTINHFTEKCIAAKRKEISSTNPSSESERISLLERILEANEVTHELTDDEVRDEVFTLFLAAQDTLAVMSSFASLMFAMHPEIQEKARKEIHEIWNNDETIDLEHLNRMKYLECCIKETLRLFPIAPLMIRRVEPELKLDTCTLPENCQVVIAAFMTHRSEKYWKNAKEFVPERFTNEETSKRHPYAFVPFSGGPMGCIGQRYAILSLKTILAHLLQNYKITTNVKMQDVKLKSDISIRSINGYKVSLEPLVCM